MSCTTELMTKRRLPMVHLSAVLAATVSVLVACGSRDESGSTNTTVDPSVSSTVAQPATQNMRTKRYCEVLLVEIVDGQATAEVYNSFPLNDCPQAQWTQLDAKAIATTEGKTIAVLNGPRYWLMDGIDKNADAATLPKKQFGGIDMYRQASVAVGSMADAAVPYHPHAVDRKTVFTFNAGRTIYELVAPDGTTYVMQTWSQQKDPALSEADLAGLASRLQLPAGWSYRSRTLTDDLQVSTVSAPANVLQDDLSNSYSQETSETSP